MKLEIFRLSPGHPILIPYRISPYYPIRYSKKLSIFYSKLFFIESTRGRVEPQLNGFHNRGSSVATMGTFELDSFRSGAAVNLRIFKINLSAPRSWLCLNHFLLLRVLCEAPCGWRSLQLIFFSILYSLLSFFF